MKLTRLLGLVLALLGIATFSYATTPDQFDTVPEMLETLKMYHVEDKTLQVESISPPNVVIVESFYGPEVMKGATVRTLRRNLVEVVFRSFAHTDVSSVSVLSAPAYVKPPNVEIKKVLFDQGVSIHISREAALGVLKKYRKNAGFEDLITTTSYGTFTVENDWAEDFSKNFLFGEDGSGTPGVSAFYNELLKASTN